MGFIAESFFSRRKNTAANTCPIAAPAYHRSDITQQARLSHSQKLQ
jgi:hypothetical protein